MSDASQFALVAALAVLCGSARAETADPPAAQQASDRQRQAADRPQPAATPTGDALDRTVQTLRDLAARRANQRARLVLMQQYSPNSGQGNPAWQWGPPAQTGSPPGGSQPQGYYAAQPTDAPASGQPAYQYGPPQPPPGYVAPMWPRQGPQQTVDTPEGSYVPGPIFGEDSPFRDAPPDIDPTRINPLKVTTEDTMTGRIMFGVGVNSDAGVVGQVLLEEQNFDWTRWPSSWQDIQDGTAFRGAGERFRIEAVPGTEVQRYAISFEEPYVFGSQVQMGLSGFYYERIYNEYTEQRLGGQISFGYALTPDLAVRATYRGQNINIINPIDPNFPDLKAVTGRNLALHGFGVSVTEDKRDNAFLATEGYMIQASFEQVLGSYDYPRAELDVRKYFTLYQRPDLSGRHVLTLSAKADITGDDTPIYDRYYAGGFSSLRGFQFRGVGPHVYDAYAATDIFYGGDFQLLASAEYMFPITADDMLRGVVFCDSGTVEPTINNWNNNYRVAPGFGLRISVPAMGPAPIALDFAFPVAWQSGDKFEIFSFFVGFGR